MSQKMNILRSRKWWRIFALAIMFILVFGLSVQVVLAHWSPAYSNENSTGVDYLDWMSSIPDTRPISYLSIPGTHDTMAQEDGIAVECQEMSMESQLYAGIRAFDIRLKLENGTLKLYHGSYDQSASFRPDILAVVTTFLQNHPGETSPHAY